MLLIAIFGIGLVFRQWAWNQGYAVADKRVRELWDQDKSRYEDERQRFVYNLIFSEIKPRGERDPHAVGVYVAPQGKNDDGEYEVDIFWWAGLGTKGTKILSVRIGMEYVEVRSVDTPIPCPSGLARKYNKSHEAADVLLVIADVQHFIAEAEVVHYLRG
jgi:hypothetical protein